MACLLPAPGGAAHMPMPPSTGRPAPVMKRDCVGGEEDHRVGHVLDLAEPAERGQLDHRADGRLGGREQPERGHVLGQPGAHLGRHQPGVDAVDPDAVAELAGLHRGHPGEPVDRGLGRRVDRDAGEGDGRGDRGDVDDAAAGAGRAARAHGPQAVLDAERGAEDVDLQHRADVLGVHLGDQAGDLDAGVVDQDVQPAELRHGLLDGGGPAGVVGDVEGDEAVAVTRARPPSSRRPPPGRRRS